MLNRKLMETRNKFWGLATAIILITTCGTFSSIAQSNDTLKIRQVIDKYIVGWRDGNKELLREAFDQNAGVVLWIDKKEDPERLKFMSLYDLVQRVKVQKEYGIGYSITSLQIVDSKLAIAFVNVPLGDNHYIDCLELQKINGRWKIVLKSYVFFAKSSTKDLPN